MPKFKKKNSGAKRLNAELNPICHLLALLGAHTIFHVNGLRVKCIGTEIQLELTRSWQGGHFVVEQSNVQVSGQELYCQVYWHESRKKKNLKKLLSNIYLKS